MLKISRRGVDAVHFVSTEIPAGTDVNLEVDWARRFDHMQQHTGNLKSHLKKTLCMHLIMKNFLHFFAVLEVYSKVNANKENGHVLLISVFIYGPQ